MASEDQPAPQPGIINLELADKNALYRAYMSFVPNGGLFIPMRETGGREYRLGEEVFLLLKLQEQDKQLPIPGKVVWITPVGAQGQRTPGIGIQFSNQDRGRTQQQIETILAGALNSNRATDTL